MSSPLRILLLGATGQLGKHVLAALVTSAAPVSLHVLVRSPEKLTLPPLLDIDVRFII